MQPAKRTFRVLAFIVDVAILYVPVILNVALGRPAYFPDWAAGWLVIAVAIAQLVLLGKTGATAGKHLVKIRVVDAATGKKASAVRLVLVRSVLNSFFYLFVPYVPVDFAFLFRPDRRCVHDLLARTMVVKAA